MYNVDTNIDSELHYLKMIQKFAIFVFLVSFPVTFASTKSLELHSEEAEALLHFIRGLIKVGYEVNKLTTIAEIVSDLQEDADTLNVTLVGTQNVYNADGTIAEIRTVELCLPQVENKYLQNADQFEADEYEKIKKIREGVQASSYLGIDLELFYQEDKENEIYWNKNLFAIKREGIFFLNKTINVDTVEEVKVDLKKPPFAYLVFDVDGKFVKADSNVEPSQLVTVTSDYNEPSAEIIATSLKSLADAFLESQNRDQVPEALRQKLSEAYPDVSFIVVTDGEPSGSYWNKDYSIQLSYNFLDLEDSLTYTVYGYNLTN